MTTVLYHWSADRAEAISHAVGDAFRVHAIGRYHAFRVDTILVVRPPPEELASQARLDQYQEWLKWLPTRLAPGREGRIFFL